MQKLLHAILCILCGLFWTILMIGFSDVKMTLFTILAALVHEGGHLMALSALKKHFSLPSLVFSGFRIKTRSPLSYKEEIWVCSAGPLINFLAFAFLFPHTPNFAIINLATAISNLLPISDYDGYKIISDTISLFFGSKASDSIMPYVSLTVCTLAVFLSLFIILILNGGYWIFSIFFIVMIRQILFFQNRIKNEDL